ncbi:MAG: TVP38/TMEM64 family protein [Deltaproteobacteria bacterium]|nr:TVP38/TMEM64 family protein [Deltaproteobacteria bacterium]
MKKRAARIPRRDAAPDADHRRGGSRVLRAAAGLALLVAGGVLVWRAGGETPRFAAWVAEQGAWAPLFYVAGYVVLTVAFVPGALPTMAAGVVFGLGPGTVYAFLGEVLGGALAFWLARSVARPLVEARLARSLLFATLDRAVRREGRRIVFLLRLSPAIPFNALNYALGLSTVRFADYLAASVGMLPGALLYVYYGKLIGDVAALASGAEAPRNAVYWTATLLGLGTTMAVSVALARAARRALREAGAGTAPRVESGAPSRA